MVIMARIKRVYSRRRRRINYRRVALLLGGLVLIILLTVKIFTKNRYVSHIEKALDGDITQMSGSISTVSVIDATVYENEGIRYTNQHEDIKRLMTFEGSLPEDADKVDDVKTLLKNMIISEKTQVLDDLPRKEDGYYWIEADIFTKDKFLIFKTEDEYNFDLYYDIEDKTVYVKEKYYDEFSKKYNKVKFQGYKATDQFIDILNDLTS